MTLSEDDDHVVTAVGTPSAAAHLATRRLGTASAVGVVILSAAYVVPLVIGFVTLPSGDVPFLDPWFSMMEVLIILTAPLMVLLTVAVHSAAPAAGRPLSLAAVVFMGIAAGITCSVHFAILTLSRRSDFAALPWIQSLLTFQWPSVNYTLDILAWDVFFGISALCLVPAFRGSRLQRAIRVLLLASGVIAIAGLVGVVLDDMSIRNIGIVGYALVYPVAAVLMVRFFQTLPGRG